MNSECRGTLDAFVQSAALKRQAAAVRFHPWPPLLNFPFSSSCGRHSVASDYGHDPKGKAGLLRPGGHSVRARRLASQVDVVPPCRRFAAVCAGLEFLPDAVLERAKTLVAEGDLVCAWRRIRWRFAKTRDRCESASLQPPLLFWQHRTHCLAFLFLFMCCRFDRPLDPKPGTAPARRDSRIPDATGGPARPPPPPGSTSIFMGATNS
jgi:hypothetical protein